MKELFAALVKAQAEMGGAVKDSANPFFKSKYADLSSVMEAIRPAFAKYGLGFIQVSHDTEHAAVIETVIIHESGESFPCGKVSCPVIKHDAQGFGSAITYAKRYSLQAAVGVPSVDDDGNAAAKAAPSAPIKKDGPTAPITPAGGAWDSMTGEQQQNLERIAMDVISYLAKARDLDAAERINAAELETDEKVALWTRFDSKQRAALKKAMSVTQPNAVAELAK